MALADEITECLRQLGTTEKQVAGTLLANHIRGVRNTVRTLNPVVRFVQNCLKNDRLDMDVIPGDTLRFRLGKQGEGAPLPKPVMQFLDAFNAGGHPEIEVPSELA